MSSQLLLLPQLPPDTGTMVCVACMLFLASVHCLDPLYLDEQQMMAHALLLADTVCNTALEAVFLFDECNSWSNQAIACLGVMSLLASQRICICFSASISILGLMQT